VQRSHGLKIAGKFFPDVIFADHRSFCGAQQGKQYIVLRGVGMMIAYALVD